MDFKRITQTFINQRQILAPMAIWDLNTLFKPEEKEQLIKDLKQQTERLLRLHIYSILNHKIIASSFYPDFACID